MCTAVSFTSGDHYFGRNLDLEYHYHEQVAVTPRGYPLGFRSGEVLQNHYAMIGMAMVDKGYPLYYDATNEAGLSVAGLHFPGNAVYHKPQAGKTNMASFEMIPFLLGKYESVSQVRKALENIQITDTAYSDGLPPSPLHWLVSDKEESIVLECMADGLHIYDDPVGVLTNNPPFPYHMYRMADYMGLSRETAINSFSEDVKITPYSHGLAAFGLPGDLSSSSRFVRAAYIKLNSVCDSSENASISQFFHILNGVAQRKGMVVARDEMYEYTVYSSCCNTSKGVYYYTTYENSQITAVDMHKCDLQSTEVISFPLVQTQQIRYEN